MAHGFQALRVPEATGDTTKPVVYRDPILNDQENDGVRFLWDAGFGFSYPAGPYTGRAAPGNPVNGAVIGDITERANGEFQLLGGSVTYSGGGFDVSSSTKNGTGVLAPAAVNADIWTAYGGVSQEYLAFGYFKTPSAANWDGVASFMGDKAYTTGNASMASVHWVGVDGRIGAYRQTASNTVESTGWVVSSTNSYSQLVQIAVWRNASGQGLRLQSANETVLQTLSRGSQNTQDFSASRFGWGRAAAFGPNDTTHALWTGVRAYRGGIINLARWNVDPATLLAADWQRVVARGDFT